MIATTIPQPLLALFTDKQMRVAYAATDDGFEVFLHGDVGDEFNQTDSLSIAGVISQNRGKPLTLRVNSHGGLAYDGVAIYNAIASHDGPTTGIIEGMAGSAASLAVLACDTVKCHESGGAFVPHYGLIMAMGHAPVLRDALEALEVLDAEMEKIYAAASGQSIEKVRQDLTGPNGDGTRFNAAAAKAAGYVDEIIPAKQRKAAASAPATDTRSARNRLALARMT